ncbi:TfuA-like protein [Rhizobium grahamii]|uniref:Antibiotic resistance protein n=2 Tax=Rhizobium grahamii TaxID=1120045 RepID=S3H7E6_9HYPH|nr:TfuA-like protein [Rhizobium grahamii]EPE94579.1 antibiotic resistance protein [Rhizobium grahamii CCGE 502]RDJ06099.1 antibiotic resistance protein [Rhizobium grahamii]
MKVIFVGPSLPAAQRPSPTDIFFRPPAVQGDVLSAARDGARVIGIIDGGFEYTAPVVHKEILHALSHRVRVFGAASMGALRAVECSPFGMVGVGRIYRDYASGAIVDDSDVALLHGPLEFGYRPFTVPMVNVRATLDEVEGLGELDLTLRLEIERAAGETFFKKRTWKAVLEKANIASADRKILLPLLLSREVDQKAMDASELVTAVQAADLEDFPQEPQWIFNDTLALWNDKLPIVSE